MNHVSSKRLVDIIQPGCGVMVEIEDIYQYLFSLCPIKDEDIMVEYLSMVGNEVLGRQPSHADDFTRMLTSLGLEESRSVYIDLDIHSMINDRILYQLGSVDYDHLHEFYLYITYEPYKTLFIRRHEEGRFLR